MENSQADDPGPFASGRCTCPWCPGSSFGTPAGFMHHVTVTHEGTCIDGAMLCVLRGIDRGVCSNTSCGGFRRVGARRCNRCNGSHSLRPLVCGDIIPGGRGVPLRQHPSAPPEADATTMPAERNSIGDIVLPSNFTERIRRLSPNTPWHIPDSLRIRIIKESTKCWEGMAAALPGWCALEEARSRLLMTTIPDGAHAPKEIATRLGLWEEGIQYFD